MSSITKVVATIGPSSEKKETIDAMVKHHMDIARLNFSWGTYDWFKEIIKKLRESAKENNTELSILQDLSGPRVQTGSEHHFGGEEGESVITEKDKENLAFGIEQGVDYVAMSFVGYAFDVIKLKELIKEKGGNQKVIAKVERKVAVENLAEIIKEADGIMVARGDLGNEFPIEEIPFVQHHIIEECKKADKMVIVATQMLLSMVDSPKPTRAEVSDVAYAILDGADGVMLSEESAKGNYPVEAISIMEKIALVAENHINKVKIG